MVEFPDGWSVNPSCTSCGGGWTLAAELLLQFWTSDGLKVRRLAAPPSGERSRTASSRAQRRRFRPHGRPNFQVSRGAVLLEASPCAKPRQTPRKNHKSPGIRGRLTRALAADASCVPRSIKARARLGGWGEGGSRTAQFLCVISHSSISCEKKQTNPSLCAKMRRRKCARAAPRQLTATSLGFPQSANQIWEN